MRDGQAGAGGLSEGGRVQGGAAGHGFGEPSELGGGGRGDVQEPPAGGGGADAGAGAPGSEPEQAGAGGSGGAQPGPGLTSAYLYAGTTTAKIVGYAVDAQTGALSTLPTSPYDGVLGLGSEHPSGRFFYATNYNGNTVSGFAVGSEGALSLINTLPAGSSPEVAKVHPSGDFLYAGNIFGGGTSIYTIDRETGKLAASTPLDAGLYNHGLAFDPTGQYFYLARNNSNDVTRFVVDAETGASSDPKTLAAVGGYHAAMDPLGQYLFVSSWDKGGNKVSSYELSAVDGTVTRVGDYDSRGTTPAGLAVTPDGRWLYVVNYGNQALAGFAIDRATGALSPVAQTPLNGPDYELCLDHSGRFLYAGTTQGLNGYTIDAQTGVLTTIAGSPFQNGLAAADLSVGHCVLVRKTN